MVGSTWSPDSSTPLAGSSRQRWSGVWPGCEHRHPLAAGEGDDVGVGEAHGRGRGRGRSRDRRPGRYRIRSSSMGVRRRSPLHGLVRSTAAVPARRTAVVPWPWWWRRSDRLGGLGAGLVLVELGVGDGSHQFWKARCGHDRPRLRGEGVGAAEVVDVGVGDDDGVHVARLVAGVGQARGERLRRSRDRAGRGRRWRRRGRREGVAVHVPEAGQRHRQLHPQHARGDLGDLGCCGLLLLRWSAAPRRSQSRARVLDRAGQARPVSRCAAARGLAEEVLAVEPQLGDALADVVEGAVRARLARRRRPARSGYQRRASSLIVDTSTER